MPGGPAAGRPLPGPRGSSLDRSLPGDADGGPDACEGSSAGGPHPIATPPAHRLIRMAAPGSSAMEARRRMRDPCLLAGWRALGPGGAGLRASWPQAPSTRHPARGPFRPALRAPGTRRHTAGAHGPAGGPGRGRVDTGSSRGPP
ncbi:hypothetical protein H696_06117 [Fonticula alba]|uniref:Uncharacterized protein n=1 Tax=Fonticula alba TaxID=691883 RepID=A0A058YZL7_FONAL|nr:hypothetical protein H696_06117 [Fonticula alba]KCV67425.1 hypothetical protein H696_06117 [Fonticula alba]|eukprot:XP_009498152.1 hypothetical protein H696_06117 [Fonticula alba]